MARIAGVTNVDASVALLRAHHRGLVSRRIEGQFHYGLTDQGRRRLAWFDAQQGEGQHILRRATEIKNVWIPYGDQT